MTRMCLVCAAEFNAEVFAAELSDGFDMVVAVDGGLLSLRKAGVRPHVALGDFDSLGFVPGPEDADETAVFPAEKDASDFQLAMDFALHKGATDMWVFGALGGRLDQTLAALQVGVGAASQLDTLVFVGTGETVHVVGPNRTLALKPGPARYVSVFSAVDLSRNVVEQGMKYSLDADLSNRQSRGLSNEFTDRPACISVGDGVLLVVEQL